MVVKSEFKKTAKKLGLESTLRLRRRTRKSPEDSERDKLYLSNISAICIMTCQGVLGVFVCAEHLPLNCPQNLSTKNCSDERFNPFTCDIFPWRSLCCRSSLGFSVCLC